MIREYISQYNLRHCRTITEPAREIPLLAETDVLLILGGSAGVAAAITIEFESNNLTSYPLVDTNKCVGCVVCAVICPSRAIN